MQSVKECYLCRRDAEALGYYGALTDEGLDKHHVIYGTANRRLSDQTGLWVYLCKRHHNLDNSPVAVHFNRAVREELCRDAQRAYLRDHSFEDWMEKFGRNYLEADEINRIKTKAEQSLKTDDADSMGCSGVLQAKNRIMTKPPDGFVFLEGQENEHSGDQTERKGQ